MELGERCQHNAKSWRQRATVAIALAKTPQTTVDEFRKRLASATMSTNVTAAKIRQFDKAGILLSSRELAIKTAASDDSPVRATDALRGWHRGEFSPARSAFEKLWTRGRRFVYGAVNIGGLGTLRYGPFCLVIDDPTRLASQVGNDSLPRVGVFPSDTAQTYTPDDPSEPLAENDVACWDSRADVAVNKHAADLLHTPTAQWGGMLCGHEDYVEVCVADRIAISDLSSVRVQRQPRQSRSRRRARSLAYSQTSELPGSVGVVAEAEVIIERWNRLGVQIEVIP